MSDIVLSQGIRSNLLSLQSSASLLDKTQNRLATGKKVNSALDDPLNYFTSGALNTRANDLQRLLDGIGLGIKTIEAADNGLKNITRVLEQIQAGLRTSLTSNATNAKVASGSTANGTLLDWRPDPITNAPKNLSSAAAPPGPFTNGDTITFSYTVPPTSLPPARGLRGFSAASPLRGRSSTNPAPRWTTAGRTGQKRRTDWKPRSSRSSWKMRRSAATGT